MKNLLPRLLSLFASLVLLFTPGCSTNSASTQADIAAIANIAAYTGASVDLIDNPDRRPLYVASYEALNTLIRDEKYSPAAFQDALAGLPVKELSGGKGTLVVGGAVVLWTTAINRIDIDKVELVKTVSVAVRDGLGRALGK